MSDDHSTVLPPSAIAFHRMLAQAKDQALYASPPYPMEATRAAFLQGYEYALRDVAAGKIDVE